MMTHPSPREMAIQLFTNSNRETMKKQNLTYEDLWVCGRKTSRGLDSYCKNLKTKKKKKMVDGVHIVSELNGISIFKGYLMPEPP